MKKIILIVAIIVALIFGLSHFKFFYGKVYTKSYSYRVTGAGEASCAAMTPECGVCVISDNLSIKGIIIGSSCYLPIE